MSSPTARCRSITGLAFASVLVIALSLSLSALAATAARAQAARDVTVFAAASLTNVLKAIAAEAPASSARIKVSFAASSTLARQIESGAAADLFVSADDAWMDYLDKRGLLEPGTRRPLLGNSLALVVPKDRPIKLEIGNDRAWLSRLPAGRIATGDPSHVPVGRYAEQALRKLGVWNDVAPRLARADNVRNALVLVERGEAAAGIVYTTDVLGSKGAVVAGTFPAESHAPIIYPVALIKGRSHSEALAFLALMTGHKARAIFLEHGFTVR